MSVHPSIFGTILASTPLTVRICFSLAIKVAIQRRDIAFGGILVNVYVQVNITVLWIFTLENNYPSSYKILKKNCQTQGLVYLPTSYSLYIFLYVLFSMYTEKLPLLRAETLSCCRFMTGVCHVLHWPMGEHPP